MEELILELLLLELFLQLELEEPKRRELNKTGTLLTAMSSTWTELNKTNMLSLEMYSTLMEEPEEPKRRELNKTNMPLQEMYSTLMEEPILQQLLQLEEEPK